MKIVPKGGSGIETLENIGIKVWGEKNKLHIQRESNLNNKTADIYNLSGQLVKSETLNSNLTVIPLDKGLYIVKIGNGVGKVIVK